MPPVAPWQARQNSAVAVSRSRRRSSAAAGSPSGAGRIGCQTDAVTTSASRAGACPASPVHYQYNPVKTVKTNVMGAINMLGLA